MHWLLIVIITLALLAASTVSFRLGAGLLAALVVLAVGAYFLSGGGWRPGSGDDAEVVASETAGEPAYAGSWRISTTLANNSETATVRDLTLEIAALSCPSVQSDDADCAAIDTIEHRLGIDIPPGASRNTSFTLSPRELGDIDNSRWRVNVVEVRTR